MYKPLMVPTKAGRSEQLPINQICQPKITTADLIEINNFEIDNTLGFNPGREKTNRESHSSLVLATPETLIRAASVYILLTFPTAKGFESKEIVSG